MSKKPVMLCIMDGFGWVPDHVRGNAIAAAKKPNIDRFMAEYPTTTIGASGMDVGLPDGQMGNSEVGHTNMGAGRIVYQQLTLITKSIQEQLSDYKAHSATFGEDGVMIGDSQDITNGKISKEDTTWSAAWKRVRSEALYELPNPPDRRDRKRRKVVRGFIDDALTAIIGTVLPVIEKA